MGTAEKFLVCGELHNMLTALRLHLNEKQDPTGTCNKLNVRTQKIALIYFGHCWPSSEGITKIINKYFRGMKNIGFHNKISTIRNYD
jgi:hypothetical protein